MSIELLSRDNLEQLILLVLEFWPECNFEEEHQHYDRLINREDEVVLLVRQDTAYAGFAHASTRTEYVEGADTSPVGYLEAVFVKPLYRKNGMARKLVEEIEAWARSKGLKQLASDTAIINAGSIAFHEEAGFEEVNRIVCFMKDI